MDWTVIWLAGNFFSFVIQPDSPSINKEKYKACVTRSHRFTPFAPVRGYAVALGNRTT